MGNKDILLEVDEHLCTACGLCEQRAPEHLSMDDDAGVAQILRQPIGKVETDSCWEAVDYCPSGGLTATTADAAENAA